jgi:superfamily II DNA or RNA helicase
MEEYAISISDSDDDILDMPLIRKQPKKKEKSKSSSIEDTILSNKPPKKKSTPEFFEFEEESEDDRGGGEGGGEGGRGSEGGRGGEGGRGSEKVYASQITKVTSPKRKVIDYTKTLQTQAVASKKKIVSQKSPVKQKTPPKRVSPKKSVKQVEYTEEQCESFIAAASKVGIKEKFVNPITKKEITKGSAAYNKYLKDCQGVLTVETKQTMKEEKESEIKKFGQRNIYRCEDYKIKPTGTFEPTPHQIIARNRFGKILDQPKDPLRGLLLYYGLGSGKTCTYAMIADLYHKVYPDRPIFVFTPGSLRTNFLEQYCSFCGLNPKDISKSFAFYSINDTSIIRKLPKRLDNSLVIVDEVHKLTHGKANDSPIISLIYDIINNSENVNIVSGSGTPIETNLEELFYLTNLHIKEKFDIMPDFKGLFKWKEGVFYPKNKEKLVDLFSQFVSYYDPQKKMESTQNSAFPKVYYKNVYVPINPERERAYMDLVDAENEKMKKPNEDMKFTDYARYKRQKQKYYIAASRLRSSQESNYSYPILNPKEFKKGGDGGQAEQEEGGGQEGGDGGDVPIALEEGGGNDNLPSKFYKSETPMDLLIPDKLKEYGGWITKDVLKDLYDQGEKITEIIKDIEKFEGKHAIYTRFKTYFGSRLLGAILDLKEIPYVYFDGDMNDKDRVEVLEKFNAPNNINGDKIKVIILTSAGSAGINLKEIRRFHILEQYFNLSYLKQVVGRGNRYLSHQRLPENKRNLTVLNYFLQLSDDELTENYSSDVLSYKMGKQKDNAISEVRELLTTLDI